MEEIILTRMSRKADLIRWQSRDEVDLLALVNEVDFEDVEIGYAGGKPTNLKETPFEKVRRVIYSLAYPAFETQCAVERLREKWELYEKVGEEISMEEYWRLTK